MRAAAMTRPLIIGIVPVEDPNGPDPTFSHNLPEPRMNLCGGRWANVRGLRSILVGTWMSLVHARWQSLKLRSNLLALYARYGPFPTFLSCLFSAKKSVLQGCGRGRITGQRS